MTSDTLGVCFVHRGNPVSTLLLHNHHVVPQGYGGQDVDSNTCWLCATCHDVLHKLAIYVRHNKKGLAQDLAQQHLPHSPKARERFWDLVKVAADAADTFIPEAGDDADDTPILMSLRVPRDLHKRLKILAGERTHAKSGRRVGLYRYCLEVLQKHVEVKLARPGLKGTEAFTGPEDAEQDKPDPAPPWQPVSDPRPFFT